MPDKIVYAGSYKIIYSTGVELPISNEEFENLKASGKLKIPYINEKCELIYEVRNAGENDRN